MYIKDIKRRYDPYTDKELIEDRDWKYLYPNDPKTHMNFIASVEKSLMDNAFRILKELLITNPTTKIVNECDECDLNIF